jgi:hypothetical protein
MNRQILLLRSILMLYWFWGLLWHYSPWIWVVYISSLQEITADHRMVSCNWHGSFMLATSSPSTMQFRFTNSCSLRQSIPAIHSENIHTVRQISEGKKKLSQCFDLFSKQGHESTVFNTRNTILMLLPESFYVFFYETKHVKKRKFMNYWLACKGKSIIHKCSLFYGF